MAIDKTTLGKAIRQVRNLRGMSQAALAEEAGIQGNSLALIERGQRGVSMDTLNSRATIKPDAKTGFIIIKAGPDAQPTQRRLISVMANTSRGLPEQIYSAPPVFLTITEK